MSAAVQIRSLYGAVPERLARARTTFRRPLTLDATNLIAHGHDRDRQPRDPARSVPVEPADASLAPPDTKARPGKDV
jgi:hypothetical protein